MKLSRLIQLLQDLEEKYGDEEVKVYDGDGGFTSVVSVATPEDGDGHLILCDAETAESFA